MRCQAILMLMPFLLSGAAQAQDRTDPEGTPTTVLPSVRYGGGGYGAGPSVDSLQKSRDESGRKRDERITHQPLINIKVRVVEVDRSDTLDVSSILDYFSGAGDATSRTSGSPLNANPTVGGPGLERLGAVSRFSIPGLITDAATGSGTLVNLTSKHVNWVASLLATEFNADTINAPQVTTINGNNVVFRSGSKVPFQTGANIIQNGTSTIEQVFYKHVGLYISVTPDIVNWGENHEGRGSVPSDYHTERTDLSLERDNSEITPKDIADIGLCLKSLRNQQTVRLDEYQDLDLRDLFEALKNHPEVESDPEFVFDVVELLSEVANKSGLTYARMEKLLGGGLHERPLLQPGPGCDWRATECTVNLDVVVRLSDAANFNKDGVATSEGDVRAISNVVQVQSGHGIVMGGLISMGDQRVVAKVPVLGDVPLLGAAFRSKTNQRRKTETLIFIEAEVLPPLNTDYGEAVRQITAREFCAGAKHLDCDLCNGVLANGLSQAGVTSEYLPPMSHEEAGYWKDYRRDLRHRKVSTQLFDTLHR